MCENKPIIDKNGEAHPGGPFYPFTNEPLGGWNLIYGAGPAQVTWALGTTDDTFLSDDPDKRAASNSGMPSSDLFNDIFVNNVSGRVQQPPWPSQLAFYLNTYATQRQVTSGKQICEVDGNEP